MRVKKHKILRFILAVLLFVTGLFLEVTMTGMLAALDSTGNADANLGFCHTNINDIKILTTETLGDYCTAKVEQSEQFQAQKREIKASSNLLFADFTAFVQGKFFVFLKNPQVICRLQNDPVTDYIHRSDGKKRI